MKSLRTVIAVSVATLLPAAALAEGVPALMNNQGILRTAAGGPVADGQYDLTFSLYANQEDLVPVWTEVVTGVVVQGGFYSTVLGNVVALPPSLFRDNPELWIGIRVGDGAEMPRRRLMTLAYAFEADHAVVATTAESLDCLGCVSNAAIGFDLCAATDACSVTLDDLACSPDQIPRYSGGSWKCDAETRYTGGAAIVVDGGVISVDTAAVQDLARLACFDSLSELTAALAGQYAAPDHTHPYAAVDHTHPYAPLDHAHPYAPVEHDHPQYAPVAHGHLGSEVVGPVAEATKAGDADTVDGKHAADFEPIGAAMAAVTGAITAHEASKGHMTPAQAAELTGGGPTTLHTHPGTAQPAHVRVIKGDYNVGPGQTTSEFVHVLESKPVKVYLYLYGRTPVSLLLPNHNHGAHSHTFRADNNNDSDCNDYPCGLATDAAQVGDGSYPLTNISATSIPKTVQIWVDGVNRTAEIGDQNQQGPAHWNDTAKAWGTGTAWSTGRLDLTAATAWGTGEHILEFRETGNQGGRLLYYLYVVTPAGQSSPPPNDTCAAPQVIDVSSGSATVRASTQDVLGETKALDNASGSCGGSGGADVMYSITLAARSLLTVNVVSGWAPKVYLKAADCLLGPEIACADRTFTTAELEPGTYFLVVDGANATAMGDFILNVSTTPAPLPANDTCATAKELNVATGSATDNGTTLYAKPQYEGTCGGAAGADVVYTFETTAPRNATIKVTPAGWTSVMYLRAADCLTGFVVGCTTTGTITVSGLSPGRYYLVVDGTTAGQWGPFSLSVTLL